MSLRPVEGVSFKARRGAVGALAKAVWRGMSVEDAKLVQAAGSLAGHPGSKGGDIGRGIYTTPNKKNAMDYAREQRNGVNLPRSTRRIGRVAMFEEGKTRPLWEGTGGQNLYFKNKGVKATADDHFEGDLRSAFRDGRKSHEAWEKDFYKEPSRVPKTAQLHPHDSRPGRGNGSNTHYLQQTWDSKDAHKLKLRKIENVNATSRERMHERNSGREAPAAKVKREYLERFPGVRHGPMPPKGTKEFDEWKKRRLADPFVRPTFSDGASSSAYPLSFGKSATSRGVAKSASVDLSQAFNVRAMGRGSSPLAGDRMVAEGEDAAFGRPFDVSRLFDSSHAGSKRLSLVVREGTAGKPESEVFVPATRRAGRGRWPGVVAVPGLSGGQRNPRFEGWREGRVLAVSSTPRGGSPHTHIGRNM